LQAPSTVATPNWIADIDKTVCFLGAHRMKRSVALNANKLICAIRHGSTNAQEALETRMI
jgi:hypothetical protein